MSKFWVVFWNDYSRRVFRWRFLFVALIPLMMPVIMLAVSLPMILISEDWSPFGYVDEAGLLVDPQTAREAGIGTLMQAGMIEFTSEEEASQALEKKDIQAYFILPADFLESHRARQVYQKLPNSYIDLQFREFVRLSLLQNQPEQISTRIRSGPEFIIQNPEQDRQTNGNLLLITAPLIGAFFFSALIFATSAPLLLAFTREQENRVLEIMMTSMSSQQLFNAKTLAGLCTGLTAMLVWISIPALILLAVPQILSLFGDASAVWRSLAPILLIFLLACIMVSAMMALIGVAFARPGESQFVAAIVSLVMNIPLVFIFNISGNPSGPLALAFSFFPLTAPLTMILRLSMGAVPAWQTGLVVVTQAAGAVISMWLAGKAFRASILLQGQSIFPTGRLRDQWQKLTRRPHLSDQGG